MRRGRSGTMEAPKTETQIWALGPRSPWLPIAQSGAQKWERIVTRRVYARRHSVIGR